MLQGFSSYIRLVLAVWLQSLCVHLTVNAEGQFSLYLVSLSNARLSASKPCDNFDECDAFCTVSPVTCGDDCRIGVEKQTKSYTDNNSPTFGSDLGNGLSNPLIYYFKSWNGFFEVNVTCRDYDDGGPNDVIGVFNFSSLLVPAWGTQMPLVMQNTSCTEFSTCLQVNYSAACSSHHYGPNCQVFCYPRDNSTGHYKCDVTNGTKICLDGWTGTECLSPVTPTQPSIPPATSTPPASDDNDWYIPVLWALLPLSLAMILGLILYWRVKKKRRLVSFNPEANHPTEAMSGNN